MRIWVVDAFTDRVFTGNPAAVVPLERWLPDATLQAIAVENKLSETAFFVPTGLKGNYQLRWFTPTTEVPICGHATLASAHRLWEEGFGDGEIRFHTRSGILSAARRGDGILLDFPAEPPQESPAPTGLSEALGAPFVWTGTNRLGYLVVELPDARSIPNLEPDVAAIARLPVSGVVATAAAHSVAVTVVRSTVTSQSTTRW